MICFSHLGSCCTTPSMSSQNSYVIETSNPCFGAYTLIIPYRKLNTHNPITLNFSRHLQYVTYIFLRQEILTWFLSLTFPWYQSLKLKGAISLPLFLTHLFSYNVRIFLFISLPSKCECTKTQPTSLIITMDKLLRPHSSTSRTLHIYHLRAAPRWRTNYATTYNRCMNSKTLEPITCNALLKKGRLHDIHNSNHGSCPYDVTKFCCHRPTSTLLLYVGLR